ncbi:unnamed protein product [Adineta steineri]|uniref:Uncharacterized protein n=1 Tax=Adineta steineri TaxID=433720 RepID=A0A813ZQD7_9BILA|nr:unnamed protein product [Adineta steineri]CAF0929618.1 unnamed protein product [Adineta steineri]
MEHMKNHLTPSMLMTSTTVTPSVLTPFQSCNTSKCRAIIADYFSKTWAFNTVELTECAHCPSMTTAVMNTDWLNLWYEEDFFIKNSTEQDLEKKPVFGIVSHCAKRCFEQLMCVGFARNKNIADDANGECWLKNNITVNRIYNHPEWHAFVLNITS